MDNIGDITGMDKTMKVVNKCLALGENLLKKLCFVVDPFKG